MRKDKTAITIDLDVTSANWKYAEKLKNEMQALGISAGVERAPKTGKLRVVRYKSEDEKNG